jgi:hypothetical protein
MQLTAEDKKMITDFNRNVAWLKAQTLKDTTRWVKVSKIKSLTGWTRNDLKNARRNGSIVFKRDDKGVWYDPSSIAPEHLKNKLTAA